MLGPVMVHVTPLAKRGEVRIRVVGGVMIAMGDSQYDLGHPDGRHLFGSWQHANRPALPIAPGSRRGIPPMFISEVRHPLPMLPTTALTAAPCPPEPDHGRELEPVYGVEVAVLALDGHEHIWALPRPSRQDMNSMPGPIPLSSWLVACHYPPRRFHR